MVEEVVSKMSPGDLIPVLAIVLGIGAGVIISITAIIAGCIRRCREREMATTFVQDLLERGLAAEEIERLVRATAPEGEAERLIRAQAAKQMTAHR